MRSLLQLCLTWMDSMDGSVLLVRKRLGAFKEIIADG